MIRSHGDFINNGEGYLVVHFRTPYDKNGNTHHAWVAFDVDTGYAIATCDDGQLKGVQLEGHYHVRRKVLADILEMRMP